MLAFCQTGQHEYTTAADIIGADCPGHARLCNVEGDTLAVLKAWIAPLTGSFNSGDLFRAFRAAVTSARRVTEAYPGVHAATAEDFFTALEKVAVVNRKRHAVFIDSAVEDTPAPRERLLVAI